MNGGTSHIHMKCPTQTIQTTQHAKLQLNPAMAELDPAQPQPVS